VLGEFTGKVTDNHTDNEKEQLEDTQSLCSITLGYEDGPRVRAEDLRLWGPILGSQQFSTKSIQQIGVDGAGAWLGHVQHILANNKCVA
jgi:hypothetical protein